jgi:hypothetical protein
MQLLRLGFNLIAALPNPNAVPSFRMFVPSLVFLRERDRESLPVATERERRDW